MQYYNQQQQPPQGLYGTPVVWSLAGLSGVIGFSNVANFVGYNVATMANPEYYAMDYRFLPYMLRNGDEQVLSRWNMVRQKLTVSRVQCTVAVSADGTATLTSYGKGPTLWRAYGGPWNGLYYGQAQVLADGDQIALDWHHPESAVFAVGCQLDQSGGAGGYGYDQRQHEGGVGGHLRAPRAVHGEVAREVVPAALAASAGDPTRQPWTTGTNQRAGAVGPPVFDVARHQ